MFEKFALCAFSHQLFELLSCIWFGVDNLEQEEDEDHFEARDDEIANPEQESGEEHWDEKFKVGVSCDFIK